MSANRSMALRGLGTLGLLALLAWVILRPDARSDGTLYALAQAAADAGRYQEANRLLAIVDSRDNDHYTRRHPPKLVMADNLVAAGDVDGALALLESLEALKEDEITGPLVGLEEARLLARLGRKVEAKERIGELRRRFGRSPYHPNLRRRIDALAIEIAE